MQVIEKGPQDTPPLYKIEPDKSQSSLRRFIALPSDQTLVLAPRRINPVPCPSANSNTAVSVLTSVGFRQLSSDEYAEAAARLRPDIAIGMADVVNAEKSNVKRTAKMSDRTASWLSDLLQQSCSQVEDAGSTSPGTAIFAPILPIPKEQQKEYLHTLQTDFRTQLRGLALYDPGFAADIPEPLTSLPRMSLGPPKSPHHILQQISLGLDLLTIPFINDATDAGIALSFAFSAPPPTAPSSPSPLGIDMWPATHSTDISPLTAGCTCYACTRHHRAYVQHLLAAKEMLGWVLLQVHNHRVLDDFFAGVRASIVAGRFERDVEAFSRAYEPELPAKTGQGPRVRGYQFKSEGPGEPKRNPATYTTLDDTKERLAEAAVPSPNVESTELEAKGFAEKASN